MPSATKAYGWLWQALWVPPVGSKEQLCSLRSLSPNGFLLGRQPCSASMPLPLREEGQACLGRTWGCLPRVQGKDGAVFLKQGL